MRIIPNLYDSDLDNPREVRMVNILLTVILYFDSDMLDNENDFN